MEDLRNTIALWQRRHSSEISEAREITHMVKKSPLTIAGLSMVLALVVVALLAPYIAPHDPVAMHLDNRLASPSITHLLGTDELGRDILSRIIFGAGVALKIMIIVLLIDLPLGVFLGIVAGYCGGWIDEIIMRMADIFMAFPRLILAMAIGTALGPSLVNTMIAIAMTMWPTYARLARGETLSIKERTFIEVEKALGTSKVRILFSCILPLCSSTTIIRATLDMGNVIRIAAGMSFLGLGVQEPRTSLGTLVDAGVGHAETSPWMLLFPSLALAALLYAFNFIGDGLRDALDVRQPT